LSFPLPPSARSPHHLIGGAGDDFLSDAASDGDEDLLEGGPGDDFLDVFDQDGRDTADGGPDADLCLADGGDTRISCPLA
jgi:hypothetical protein